MQNRKGNIIVFSLGHYPCKIGGIEVFNYYLVHELNEYYNVKLVTECDKNDFKNVEIIKFKKYKKLLVPLKNFMILFKNRRDTDMFYFGYSESHWFHLISFVIAKKLFGIPYFFTIHGGAMLDWKPKFVHKLLFKNADIVTGVSDRIVKEYQKRSHKNIEFTPPLLPFTIHSNKSEIRKKWNVNIDDKVLLYVGSLKPLKSVDTLINALSKVDFKMLLKNNIKILIAGDGESKKELERQTIDKGLDKIITFLGSVPKEEVSELYAIANYYTICSKYEGLPISLLEAYCNGLPTVISDAPGLIEISVDSKNSLVFKTGCADDYAEKLENMFENLKVQETLKTNALAFYNNNFNYKILINQFKKIINKHV